MLCDAMQGSEGSRTLKMIIVSENGKSSESLCEINALEAIQIKGTSWSSRSRRSDPKVRLFKFAEMVGFGGENVCRSFADALFRIWQNTRLR